MMDWVRVCAILAPILAVMGWALWTEHAGYCISDYTCSYEINPEGRLVRPARPPASRP